MSISLIGNSGCTLTLALQDNVPVVVKSNGKNLDLDYRVLSSLADYHIAVPEYYKVSPDQVIMQYLDGLSILDYIQQGKDLDKFLEFLSTLLDKFAKHSCIIDITGQLENKFSQLESTLDYQLLFMFDKLFDCLPKQVPCNIYHGDLTFGNIIYWNNDFYLIDANATELNSMAFDSAKLRQDSECLWFLRDLRGDVVTLDRINYINSKILKFNKYTNNDSLLIFMLLRVLPYCVHGTHSTLLINHIHRLWKNLT